MNKRIIKTKYKWILKNKISYKIKKLQKRGICYAKHDNLILVPFGAKNTEESLTLIDRLIGVISVIKEAKEIAQRSGTDG